ncbi:PREDICTED: uncharacterized protein LOC107072462 [Polistes dominula]|uniref:Uncharacterized protein LOC107072462 n=1 Tax=Polistes dominula TaxID=743375 RepID=A0ABM1J628_POLDO|nr:PREDICTED: uncharacterized protein LOC107072462 [Polistes dominula]
MDRYVSTYQKDYTWPYPTRKEKEKLATDKDEIFRIGPCTCGMDPKDLQVARTYGERYDWSRVGPMGPLFDPKLYSAKTGPSPETEETQFGQPYVYLKKLEEKYPYLYGVIEGGPSEETIMEVEKDRMMTTYMMDYNGGRRLKTTEITDDDTQICESTSLLKSIKRDCRPHIRPPLPKFPTNFDRNGKSIIGGDRKRGKKSDDTDGLELTIPPWKSEYQDNIGKVGHAIMKHKLHYPEQKLAPIRLITN